jgi:signal transduction histidine kinase
MDLSNEKSQLRGRYELLAEITSLLFASLDNEAMLKGLAQSFVPALADWSVIDIVEEPKIHRLEVIHKDPVKIELVGELCRRYPPEAADPHTVLNLFQADEPELYSEISDSTLVAAAHDKDHLRILRELGFKSCMVVPLQSEERTLGSITFVIAESDRRYNRSDLDFVADLAARISKAVENAIHFREAREANHLKDEFLLTLSHELRMPLTSMLGWIRLLRSGRLDEATAVRAMETIERNVKSQAQLVNDLLDISRIITGKLRLDIQPVDLTNVIKATVDALRPAADAKNIRLQMVLDSMAGPVSGDPERLQQVIWNLLSNSIKFTPKGGRVQIRLERINSHIEIIVSDSGEGIDTEVLPLIFDNFRQAEGRATRVHTGLGLGLSIVHHLVELHGGTILADSPGKGQGATFIVRLPLLILHKDLSDPERVHPTGWGDISFRCPPEIAGLKVLVVDDEPDTCEMLRALLEGCQAEVRICTSTDEALEEIDQWMPDVLISDIGLPGDNGYELIRQVREREKSLGRRIPAIALTAFARVEDRIQAISAGFHMHVPKPVEPTELVAIVASLASLIGER